MLEQIVVKERFLVQVNGNALIVQKVMVLPGGHLMLSVLPPDVIVPGCPISDLMPLHDHQEEIKAIVWRAMNAGISPSAKS